MSNWPEKRTAGDGELYLGNQYESMWCNKDGDTIELTVSNDPLEPCCVIRLTRGQAVSLARWLAVRAI